MPRDIRRHRNRQVVQGLERIARWRLARGMLAPCGGSTRDATLQALFRVQEDEAARRLLAPEREPGRARSVVQRLPRQLLPRLVRREPRCVQLAAAKLLPPEPRAAARIQS